MFRPLGGYTRFWSNRRFPKPAPAASSNGLYAQAKRLGVWFRKQVAAAGLCLITAGLLGAIGIGGLRLVDNLDAALPTAYTNSTAGTSVETISSELPNAPATAGGEPDSGLEEIAAPSHKAGQLMVRFLTALFTACLITACLYGFFALVMLISRAPDRLKELFYTWLEKLPNLAGATKGLSGETGTAILMTGFTVVTTLSGTVVASIAESNNSPKAQEESATRGQPEASTFSPVVQQHSEEIASLQQRMDQQLFAGVVSTDLQELIDVQRQMLVALSTPAAASTASLETIQHQLEDLNLAVATTNATLGEGLNALQQRATEQMLTTTAIRESLLAMHERSSEQMTLLDCYYASIEAQLRQPLVPVDLLEAWLKVAQESQELATQQWLYEVAGNERALWLRWWESMNGRTRVGTAGSPASQFMGNPNDIPPPSAQLPVCMRTAAVR